jgi:hypothetical protein
MASHGVSDKAHKARRFFFAVALAGVAGTVGYMIRHRQELESPAEFAPSVWITPEPQT